MMWRPTHHKRRRPMCVVPSCEPYVDVIGGVDWATGPDTTIWHLGRFTIQECFLDGFESGWYLLGTIGERRFVWPTGDDGTVQLLDSRPTLAERVAFADFLDGVCKEDDHVAPNPPQA